jgi:exopolysaccharide biosynthesis polyprenyl glycosylphosphotransferase
MWPHDVDGFHAELAQSNPHRGLLCKRILDILISISLLVFTGPLMILVALAIKCESRGPVLYRQQRIGSDNGVFTLLKFRSMICNAEPDGKPVWASENDIRVTRLGRLIRCTRIDELPQLLNVLRGEMSIVGPRPERPYFVHQLNAITPLYMKRHSVKPGITGWAQVNYPYGASIGDAIRKLEYDLYYIQNWSILLDLKILLATIGVVILRRGAR